MMQTNNQWHKANLAQCDTLVELMEEFYVEEVLDFCPQRANRSAKELLSSDQFGAVLFLNV